MHNRLSHLVLALAAALLAAALGCSDHVAAPAAPGTGDAWTKIYPRIALDYPYAVWGMTDDDVWAVGSQGGIVHYDGESLHEVASPTENWLLWIDGNAADDIWAAGPDVVVHYDGHAWGLVPADTTVTPRGIACRAPGEMYLCGETSTTRDSRFVVMRFDGGSWVDTNLPGLPLPVRVQAFWSPGAAYPVILATSAGSYAFQAGSWSPCGTPGYIWDTSRDLVVADVGAGPGRGQYRLTSGGEFTFVCGDADSTYPFLIADAQAVVCSRDRYVWPFADCVPSAMSTLSMDIYDLCVPASSAGASVFAVGGYQMFMRGDAQADGSWSWSDAWDGVHARINPATLVGDEAHVYASAASTMGTGGVLTLDRYRAEVQTVYGGPGELHALGAGRLSGIIQGRIQVRSAQGDWSPVGPTPPRGIERYWTDGDAALVTYGDGCWVLSGGAWAAVDSLRGGASWIDGFAIDDIYARNAASLYRFDGQSWHLVLDGHDWPIWGVYRSPVTPRIYFSSYGREGHIEAGVVTMDLGETDVAWYDDAFCEVSPGDVYCIASTLDGARQIGILHRRDGPWDVVEPFTETLFLAIYGRAGLGLFTSTAPGNVYARDLPGEQG